MSVKTGFITLLILFIFSQFGKSQPVNKLQLKSWQEGIISIPEIYLHGSIGIGTAFLSSSDFTDRLGNSYGIEMAFPFSMGIKAGFRNILQFEYREGDSSHDLVNSGDGVSVLLTVDQIKMDYDFNEYLVKINPFYKIRSRQDAIFLLAGAGEVEYRDEVGQGFKGNSFIIGVEGTRIRNYVSISMSVKRYGITFDEGFFYNVDYSGKTKATNWSFEITFSVGLGI